MSTAKNSPKKRTQQNKPSPCASLSAVVREEPTTFGRKIRSFGRSSLVQEDAEVYADGKDKTQAGAQESDQPVAFWRRRPNAELDLAGDWLLANLENLRAEMVSHGHPL